jgi:hypothetical protein
LIYKISMWDIFGGVGAGMWVDHSRFNQYTFNEDKLIIQLCWRQHSSGWHQYCILSVTEIFEYLNSTYIRHQFHIF